jgi:hypothetical protein
VGRGGESRDNRETHAEPPWVVVEYLPGARRFARP